MDNKKVEITVKPVAWSGEKVTMYQGSASWSANKDRTIQIIGDPSPREEWALENLIKEFTLWQTFVGLTGDALNTYCRI